MKLTAEKLEKIEKVSAFIDDVFPNYGKDPKQLQVESDNLKKQAILNKLKRKWDRKTG